MNTIQTITEDTWDDDVISLASEIRNRTGYILDDTLCMIAKGMIDSNPVDGVI